MLNRLPTCTPPLRHMLQDMGNPTPAEVGKALGVSERTVRRWLKQEVPPRLAMLALYWLTPHGMGAVACEAHNAAVMHAGMAACLRSEVARLEGQLARLASIADFGSANDPAREAPVPPPQLELVNPPGEPRATAENRSATAQRNRG
jgi:hypothetical protein